MTPSQLPVLGVVQILYTREEVAARISIFADEIIAKYKGKDALFVCLLRGGVQFTSLLMFEASRKDPSFHPQVDYMKTTTYEGREAKEVKLVMDVSMEVVGRPIVIIDDVLDTGRTHAFVAEHFKQRGASSVDLVVLTQKQKPRAANCWQEATLYGFIVPDEWLVGMGCDDDRIAPEGNRWAQVIATA